MRAWTTPHSYKAVGLPLTQFLEFSGAMRCSPPGCEGYARRTWLMRLSDRGSFPRASIRGPALRIEEPGPNLLWRTHVKVRTYKNFFERPNPGLLEPRGLEGPV